MYLYEIIYIIAYMNPRQALQQIKDSTPETSIWYKISENYDEINWIRSTAKRIEDGVCKPDTLKKFFDMFGYDVDVQMSVKPKIKEEV